MDSEARAQPDAPGGIWLGASYALGRDVSVRDPYPHICTITVTGRMSGQPVKLWRRDCAACIEIEFQQKENTPDGQ